MQDLNSRRTFLLVENAIRGVLSGICGPQNVEKRRKTNVYNDANTLDGWILSQYSPYSVIKIRRPTEIQDVLKTKK